ncbi:MAG: response regulator [Ignavibacteriales bacterium]|nr:response regulator [Ignavibacteriales bacterium]
MERDRVLIVEDDVDTRFILERSLLKNNFEAITATNGLEGLKMVEEFSPKLIIADWTMPQMDGLTLCTKIKQNENYKSIYFILLTARSSLKDRVTGLDVGADDFLVKPVENQELIARIRSGIRIFNLQTELRSIEHQRAIIQLACTIGHQLNNPLSSLGITLQNLKMELQEMNLIKFNDDFELMDGAMERILSAVEALKNIQNPEVIKYANDLSMIKLNDKE